MRLNYSHTEWLALVEDMLTGNTAVRVALIGQSMKPTIKDGEIVCIEPLRMPAQEHDILLYKDTRGMPIVHRVMKVIESGSNIQYQLCADNDWYVHEIIDSSQAVGKVAYVERAGARYALSGCGFGYGAQIRLGARRLYARVRALLQRMF